MEFAILGPLEVRRDGEVVQLRRGRPRTLLISLLMHLGRARSAAALIEHLWGARLPSDPANALQAQVSYLRRALEPDAVLHTVPGGYLLDVSPDQVDAHRFQAMVSSAAARLSAPSFADVEAAHRDLEAALDLWRGEPLQDVASEPFATGESERLRELRAAALEHEADALLLLGRHEQAVALLHQRIAEYPLRERLREQLMLALFRSARQADALLAYAAARDHLVEELGVEPGPHLQRLQRAVLNHDPALDWTPLTDQPDPAATAGAGAASLPVASLPAPTTRLIGRERELMAVRNVVADHRIVTLTGPGGVGKTRLALAVAHEERTHHPVWLVELGHVRDPAVVPFEIAKAVGVATLADPLAAVAVRIADQRGLLVIDTCEHLLDTCADGALRLLRACPALAVMATSRQPLGIAGEVTWPVQPLRLPTRDMAADDVANCEAVQLFRERARAVRPDFDVDESNTDDVRRICAMLDGLPLAIELAAARTKVLSTAAILERLDDRFALLHRVGRAHDLRQQSLRAAMEWSHGLLDDDERVFFERLGVFAGRFTLNAAAAVAGEHLATEPLELLSVVVDHSLVVADAHDSYRLLDTVRAYAIDRLSRDAKELEATQRRLADWLTALAEAADARLRTAGQEAALAQLRAEVPNLRAALDWCFTSDDRTVGIRLACVLAWFWSVEGANEEAKRWLAAALETPHLDDVAQARLREGIGISTLVLGDVAGAQRALRQSFDLWVRVGAPERAVTGLVYLGVTERWRDTLEVAAATQDRAIELARRASDAWGLAWALVWRARTAADQSDDAHAATLLGESHAIAERVGDPRALGWIIHELSNAALRGGDSARALILADQAVLAHEATGWDEGLAAALTAQGNALTALGRAKEGITRHRRASQIAIELSQPYAIADALEGMSHALADAGDPMIAVTVLGCATAVREQLGVRTHAATPQGRAVAARTKALRRSLGDDAFECAFQRGRRSAPRNVIAPVDTPEPGNS